MRITTSLRIRYLLPLAAAAALAGACSQSGFTGATKNGSSTPPPAAASSTPPQQRQATTAATGTDATSANAVASDPVSSVGGTVSLPVGGQATVPNLTAESRCVSADPTIASVDPASCKVTAHKAGSTQINVDGANGGHEAVPVLVTDSATASSTETATGTDAGTLAGDGALTQQCGGDNWCLGIGGTNCSFWYTRDQAFAQAVVAQALASGKHCNSNATFVHTVCSCPIPIGQIPAGGSSPWCEGGRCAVGNAGDCQPAGGVCGPKS